MTAIRKKGEFMGCGRIVGEEGAIKRSGILGVWGGGRGRASETEKEELGGEDEALGKRNLRKGRGGP